MKKLSDNIPTYNVENYRNFIREKVLTDSDVINFIKNNNLTKEQVSDNMEQFYQFYISKGREFDLGHSPKLILINGKIEVGFVETKEYSEYRQNSKLEKTIKTEYIPPKVLAATFENISKNSKAKINLSLELVQQCKDIASGKEYKGMYIYGAAGIGKTFLMGAIYNYLRKLGEEPMIMYLPEFTRKLKAKITDGGVEEYIEIVREQKILIIDDIGAENMTEYIRDEIIGPIINYREAENLTTFFSSNLSLRDLNEVLSKGKNAIDQTKALRIVQRINAIAKVKYLDGVNEREFN